MATRKKVMEEYPAHMGPRCVLENDLFEALELIYDIYFDGMTYRGQFAKRIQKMLDLYAEGGNVNPYG